MRSTGLVVLGIAFGLTCPSGTAAAGGLGGASVGLQRHGRRRRHAFDMNAQIQNGADSPLVPGALVFVQYGGRDLASSLGTSLSNAVSFESAP